MIKEYICCCIKIVTMSHLYTWTAIDREYKGDELENEIQKYIKSGVMEYLESRGSTSDRVRIGTKIYKLNGECIYVADRGPMLNIKVKQGI